MKTKTIWMLAILFGILATSLFYVVARPGEGQPVQPAVSTPPPAEEEKPAETIDPKTARIEISPNHRAISIPVNELQGVSGNIQSGDFVDVMVTSPPGWIPPSGQLLLQKVKVLRVGQAAAPSPDQPPQTDYRRVTLEVTPADGVSLATAVQHQAAIYLMLRSPDDPSVVEPVHLLLEKLIQGGESN